MVYVPAADAGSSESAHHLAQEVKVAEAVVLETAAAAVDNSSSVDTRNSDNRLRSPAAENAAAEVDTKVAGNIAAGRFPAVNFEMNRSPYPDQEQSGLRPYRTRRGALL